MRRQPWSSWTFALFLALGCSTERRSSPVDPVDSGAGPGGPAGEEREGPDGTECAGREGTDCCSAEGGCGEGEGEGEPPAAGEGEGEGEGREEGAPAGEGEGEGEGEVAPQPLDCPPPRPIEPQRCETLHAAVAEVTADIADLPASLDLPETCGPGGYDASNYRLPEALLAANGDAAHELHVVGIRDSPADGTSVEVQVGPTDLPVMLFLSAHAATTWQLQPEPGARICQVLTHGFEEQTVQGAPAEATVEHLRHPALCNRDWAWETPNPAADDFQWMMAALRKAVGIRETTFQGCYLGGKFRVPHAP